MEQDQESPEDGEYSLEQVHARVGTTLQQTAARLDAFLGDQRYLSEVNRSTFTLRMGAFAEERNGVSLDLRVSARLVLPRTEKKLHIVLQGYDDQEEDGGPAQRPPEDPVSGNDPQLGLQYFLKTTGHNNLRADVGLRFNGFSPDPFIGARWRHSVPINTWNLRGYERLRLYAEERWESLTTVDLEHGVNDELFFRATTSGSWLDADPGFTYGQFFALYHWPGKRTLYTYEWNNSFRTYPDHALVETQLRVRFSRRTFADWILLEISPQISWRDEIDFNPSLGLLFRVEFLFGGDRIPYYSPFHSERGERDYDERYERGY